MEKPKKQTKVKDPKSIEPKKFGGNEKLKENETYLEIRQSQRTF